MVYGKAWLLTMDDAVKIRIMMRLEYIHICIKNMDILLGSNVLTVGKDLSDQFTRMSIFTFDLV